MQVSELAGTVNIPPVELSDYVIEKFTITPEAARFQNQMDALKPGRGIYRVQPGNFTRLRYKGGLKDVLMSDTHFEALTNLDAIREAKGDVLIFGLGLGLILKPIAAKPTVKSITVVEINKEIITAVAPHYPDPKITVIEGDAYNWAPPPRTRYDYIYYDIWGSFSTDLVEKMNELKKEARKFLRRGGKVRCWIHDYLKMLKSAGL